MPTAEALRCKNKRRAGVPICLEHRLRLLRDLKFAFEFVQRGVAADGDAFDQQRVAAGFIDACAGADAVGVILKPN